MTTDTSTTSATSSPPTSTPTPPIRRYLAPNWTTRHLFNPLVTTLVKLGVSVRGARELHVLGSRTGEWRRVPVNPLTIDGTRYLVAPRGETQWVRNLRVAGTGRLRLGRRIEEFTAIELHADEKPAVLRAYLRAWAFEVGKFFDGVDADSTDEQLEEIAPGVPVFRIG